MLILQGVPLQWGKQRWGGKKQADFRAKCVIISKTVGDTSIVTSND